MPDAPDAPDAPAPVSEVPWEIQWSSFCTII
jgi:hypothetical protein